MEKYIDQIKSIISFGTDTAEYLLFRDQLTVFVAIDDIPEILKTLKDSSIKFDQLLDITVIDYADKFSDYRFELVYVLFSLESKIHLLIKSRLKEEYPEVESVCNIYKSADWYERESYDMYGITFKGHPDFRRFYMPEDFVHPITKKPLYPLRKEFPLMGIEGSLALPLI